MRCDICYMFIANVNSYRNPSVVRGKKLSCVGIDNLLTGQGKVKVSQGCCS